MHLKQILTDSRHVWILSITDKEVEKNTDQKEVDILKIHYHGLSFTVAGLDDDDALKDVFGQLGRQLFFKILDTGSIEVEVFFPDYIVSPDAKFPLKIGEIAYNDTCQPCTADELIGEDGNSIAFPVWCIPVSSIITQLLRAEQCTFMVKGKGHSRNKSRRKYGGTVRCQYHQQFHYCILI